MAWVPSDLVKQVDVFQHHHMLPNRKEALVKLLEFAVKNHPAPADQESPR